MCVRACVYLLLMHCIEDEVIHKTPQNKRRRTHLFAKRPAKNASSFEQNSSAMTTPPTHTAAIDELLNLHIVIPRCFYVMNPTGEDWEQLSIAFNTQEEAEKFKDSDYHKREDPYAVIMCII